jgi:hypothetical protein
VTDRALRYRANAEPPAGPQICVYCGAEGGRLDIEHIDGEEANNAQHNKAWACRSCNTAKGARFKALDLGRRTRQYNPGIAAATFGQYAGTVANLLAGSGAASVKKSIRMMQATKPTARAKYAAQLARRRNPDAPPTFEQYKAALYMHHKGEHDAGGAIIHATPPALRSQYARRLWAFRKRKGRESEAADRWE